MFGCSSVLENLSANLTQLLHSKFHVPQSWADFCGKSFPENVCEMPDVFWFMDVEHAA